MVRVREVARSMGCGEATDARWARVSSATFVQNLKVLVSLDGVKGCLMVTSPTILEEVLIVLPVIETIK